ncbi:hypothetical protein TWF106_004221 [Orbilia oligospora]|uniref:Uncharacterized protein n=1 Tax=Orbilia oligospora TaxID=2813651 RepID=A0A7C8R0T9_ORBOL|nr:hypothetical protein TWF106_004221 [Orbilia oligospora]
MQNSYQQTPYNGNQSYAAVPSTSLEPPQYAGTDVEKAAPADFNPTPNFHKSPTKDSIYLPLIKRRVAKKTFWIVVGVVAGVIVIAIIVGVAVGVSKSKSNKKGGGKNAQGAKGGKSGSGGKGGFNSGDGEDDGGDDTGTPDGGSSSTDPCQQLVDIGAPWKDISDCLYQQHLTTMEIIDNFDGSDDYKPYTYYNPYASTGSTDKPTGDTDEKSIRHKVNLVLGIERAGKLLHGEASSFHGGLDAESKATIRQGFHQLSKPSKGAVGEKIKSLRENINIKAPKQPKINDKTNGKLNSKDHGKLDGKQSPNPNPNKVPGKSNEKTHGNSDDKKGPKQNPTKIPGKSNEKSPGGSEDKKAPKPSPTEVPGKSNEKSPGGSDDKKSPKLNPNKVPGKSNEKTHENPNERLPKPENLPGKSNEKAHGGSDRKTPSKRGMAARAIDLKFGPLIEMVYKGLEHK